MNTFGLNQLSTALFKPMFLSSRFWGCAFGAVYMYLVALTRMPGKSYRRRLRSLLTCWWAVFRALTNSICLLTLRLELFWWVNCGTHNGEKNRCRWERSCGVEEGGGGGAAWWDQLTVTESSPLLDLLFKHAVGKHLNTFSNRKDRGKEVHLHN